MARILWRRSFIVKKMWGCFFLKHVFISTKQTKCTKTVLFVNFSKNVCIVDLSHQTLARLKNLFAGSMCLTIESRTSQNFVSVRDMSLIWFVVKICQTCLDDDFNKNCPFCGNKIFTKDNYIVDFVGYKKT